MNWKCTLLGHIIDWNDKERRIRCARCGRWGFATSQGVLWHIYTSNKYDVEYLEQQNKVSDD